MTDLEFPDAGFTLEDEIADGRRLLLSLSQVPDPRSDNAHHSMGDMLIMLIVAIAGGANSIYAVPDFCEGHAAWFRRIFNIVEIPSLPTFYRFVSRLDHSKVTEALATWVNGWRNRHPIEGLEVVSLDGKALRGYVSGYLNVVSAYSSKYGIVLSGVCTEGSKQNEQAAMLRLISMLSLKDAVVTADAAGTQVQIANAVIAKGGNYVLPVKGNQHNTAESVALCFDNPFVEPMKREVVDKQGGRIESRVFEFLPLGSHSLPFTEKWSKLAAIGKVTSTVTQKNRKTGEDNVTVNSRLFITSLTDFDAFIEASRKHWGVEVMHFVLDVTFREDNCLLHEKNAQLVMNALRKVVYNVIKTAIPKVKMSKYRRRAGWIEANLTETMRLFLNA